MQTDSATTVGLAPYVVSRRIGDTIVVLDTRSGRYFQLTGSAGDIWSLFEDPSAVHDVVDTLAARHARAASDLAGDIQAFVSSALDAGLLSVVDQSEPPQVKTSNAPVRIEQSRVLLSDPLTLKEAFDRQHHIHLPDLIQPSLLALIQQLVDAGEFVDRTHDGIGTELCLRPGLATSVMQLLFNDPALRSFMALVGGHDALGCYDGRVYRMSPREGHYDSWHSDAGEDRRIALSLNLSPQGYEGGELEIRRAASEGAEWTVSSSGYGGAVMFRIDPSLRHRVIAVRGARPRTAWAGWFRSTPQFEELFLPTLHER